MNSGWWKQAVTEQPARAEHPADALGRAGRVAERAAPARDARVGPSASRRSWSRPRSGSGVVESQSRITGSRRWMTRERAAEAAA